MHALMCTGYAIVYCCVFVLVSYTDECRNIYILWVYIMYELLNVMHIIVCGCV